MDCLTRAGGDDFRSQTITLESSVTPAAASSGSLPTPASGFVPRAFPILTTPLGGSISASTVPGTTSFYTLNTTAGQGTVTIDFGSTPGVPLTAALHPQLSIFRLPPGS